MKNKPNCYNKIHIFKGINKKDGIIKTHFSNPNNLIMYLVKLI